ncbi:MAG: hypothetical protein R3E57_07260 [Porticoccaceae bacterium]
MHKLDHATDEMTDKQISKMSLKDALADAELRAEEAVMYLYEKNKERAKANSIPYHVSDDELKMAIQSASKTNLKLMIKTGQVELPAP